MRFLSMFSGIDAASVAWNPLGWEAAAFCEIEAFPSAVLAHHYPNVPNLGDVTKADFSGIGPIDLAVFGSPCQSFSIAGKRLGLDDPRGNLALYALGVVERLRPRWFLFENVPGLLSSGGGRDFGAFLGTVGDIGYQCAWRTLDAQYFNVPQRRRRVFVVGHLGDWRRAAAVLFERHSLSGHPAPRREAREAVAALTANGVGTCGADDNQGQAGHLIPQGYGGETAPTLNAAFGSKLGLDNQHIDAGAGLFVAHSLRGEGFDASGDGARRGTPLVPVQSFQWQSGGDARGLELRDTVSALVKEQTPAICFSAKDHGGDAMEDCSPTLRADGHSGSHANAGVMPAVAFSIMPMNSGKDYKARETDVAQPVMAGGPVGGNQGGDYICQSAVRRLTPRECERLQGFPDDFTQIPWRGKPASECPDGPRYKALGNSMAVPVMSWVGERIQQVEALSQMSEAA
jgi:DNA (cytosine-5)-methyltransferase 1